MRAPIAVPVILIVLSIPLIFGKVPPNHLYGFRTQKTLSSRGIWYPANRICGVYLTLASLATLLATLSLRGTGWSPEQSPVAMLAVLMGPLAAAIAASFAFIRKL